ncbi:hypothetical protein RSOL_521740 [Rhizoctonia solani AG-3 Rhs1AP]|uniref:Uncharacterized protein n=2 Tax=Rhizoctonia solani AG-3 TaxID=1086053 RepID=A0A074SA64_9AGAM|nr:hypothetical protein RSOL_521740 [Rhizoctonia solani AG-3 Rhs1AP]KEP54510.1 hypothetical protein V565_016610 [Rhizoctonia solani 123E]
MYIYLGVAILSLVASAKAVASCPEDLPLSCSKDSLNADSCCVFSPGLLEVSQIWSKKRQQWVIDEIRVLSCDALSSYSNCGPTYSPSKIHGLVEGYARHIEPLTSVSRKLGWGGLALESGDDDVAVMWARMWEQTGSCISTFQDKCFDKNMPPGEEEAWNYPGPALFVQMMHALQRKLMRYDLPGLDAPQKWYYLHFYGSPHLGNFVEDSTMTKNAEKQQKHIKKLSFFAQRERQRTDHAKWIEHDEL